MENITGLTLNGTAWTPEFATALDPKKCIGCGLCITTCPTDAISLVPKASDKTQTPPASENDWFEARAQQRGVDYSRFK